MQKDMTRGEIFPILLKFTLPLFIGNVFQQFYNMVDSIIVGRFVGEDALAAVGSMGTVVFLLTGFAMGFATGFAVPIAQSFGAGDKKTMHQYASNGIWLALISGIVMTICGILAVRPILLFMKTPDNIMADAYSYISVIAGGLVVTIFYNLFSAYLRSVGNSRAPVVVLVISAFLNVGLDLLFIVTFHMGVAGAAYATVLSQVVSVLLCLVYMQKKSRDLLPTKDTCHLYQQASKNQFRMGVPMALQFAITASGTVILQSAFNQFGSTAVASTTACAKLCNVTMQGMTAMGQTMVTYCGQNFGSGDYQRIRSGVKKAAIIEVIYSITMALLAFFLLPYFLRLFFSADTDMQVIMSWAQPYFSVIVCFYIPLSMIFLFRSALQGMGLALLPMICGVVELAARCTMSMLSLHTGSYFVTLFSDPMAWVSAGTFSMIAYCVSLRKLLMRSKKTGIRTG